MDTFEDWYYVPAYVDPYKSVPYFQLWTGPNGEHGFTLNRVDSHIQPPTMTDKTERKFNFATHKIGDPQWRGSGKTALQLDYLASLAPKQLQIRRAPVSLRPRLDGLCLRAEADFRRGWVTLTMTPDQFKDSKGNALTSWDDVDCLDLMGICLEAHPPVFKNLRWEGATPGK